MARVKYYDSTTQTWKYADMALQTGIHVGTTAPTNEAMLWVDTASNQIDSFPLTDVQDSEGNSLIVNQIAVIPSMPSGTNAGDILVWNGSAWVAKPMWQMKYTPVDWIKSSGTQYIDTLLKANAVETVIIDFEIENTGNWQAVYGTRSAGTAKSNILYIPNTDKQVRVDYSVSSGNTEQLITLGQSLWGRRAKFKIEKTLSGINIYENDVLIYNTTFSGSSWESGGNQTIFALNDNGSKTAYATMKLYSAQFLIGNALVRDFKPCTQNATGTAGLYETVEEKFYVNSGTGNFIIPT